MLAAETRCWEPTTTKRSFWGGEGGGSTSRTTDPGTAESMRGKQIEATHPIGAKVSRQIHYQQPRKRMQLKGPGSCLGPRAPLAGTPVLGHTIYQGVVCEHRCTLARAADALSGDHACTSKQACRFVPTNPLSSSHANNTACLPPQQHRCPPPRHETSLPPHPPTSRCPSSLHPHQRRAARGTLTPRRGPFPNS